MLVLEPGCMTGAKISLELMTFTFQWVKVICNAMKLNFFVTVICFSNIATGPSVVSKLRTQ